MKAKLLVLVDGSSYLFRAYHALPELTNSEGHQTGAIHGVIAMLRRLLRRFDPDYFGVVFDPPGKTLRSNWYPQYKANRPPMPSELAVQIKPLHQIIRAFGYPLIQIPEIEADDVLGTLAEKAVGRGTKVVISTGDKDLAQLVTGEITLINTMDDSILDVSGVREKFGVNPEKIVDYLSLIGDKVDNIPGVPKVGPKTAVKWLAEYGTLDNILRQAPDIKGKVGENLREFLPRMELTRRLVTILKDIDTGLGLADLCFRDQDVGTLKSLLEIYEFNTLLKELGEERKPENYPAEREINYETLTDLKDLEHWIGKLRGSDLFAFDTETTSLDYMDARVVGVSFSVEPSHAAYVPFGHTGIGSDGQLAADYVLGELRPLLEDPSVKKVGHNLKYDRNVLLNHGIRMDGILHDTMLESYINNSVAVRHNLGSVAKKYINLDTLNYEDVVGKGAKQIPFAEVPLGDAAFYAAEDADACLRLHKELYPRIKGAIGLERVYSDIEIPLIPVLSEMERTGVLIDCGLLKEHSSELETRIERLEEAAHEEAGESFNLSSTKQLQRILFEKLGLPIVSKTPKGAPSTAEAVLDELSCEYRLPELILEYRSLSKLKSTYTDKLPLQVNASTERVHTSYHQGVTATGRLSSSDPNLQNIPIRTLEGRKIRKAFIASPGNVLISADYSQIELRIMAHLSEDVGLIAAFEAGYDVHAATASELFNKDVALVNEEERRTAKAINFGLIYGMSAFGLGRQLGIGRTSAQRYIDKYFDRYVGVRKYMDKIRERAKELGYVQTVFGRRLYLPDIDSKNTQSRQYAERTAINAPMQGSAADIIKLSMIGVQEWLERSLPRGKLIMQVHDELVVEVDKNCADGAQKEIGRIMENAADMRVPLIVDQGCGQNWEEAH